MDFEAFIRRIGFETEAIDTLISVHKKVENNPGYKELLSEIRAFPVPSFQKLKGKIRVFAETVSVNQFELTLVLLCDSADVVQKRMLENGADEEMFYETISDLKYKAAECKALYGVWGIFVLEWYELFYKGERFGIGRLQFQQSIFPYEQYSSDGAEIKKGQPLITIHIPSSGPLTTEAVENSLQRAAAFFNLRYGGKTFFICGSWLLYPPYKTVFECSANIRAFMDLFDVIETRSLDTFSDGWRVFNQMDCSDPDRLPTKTSLQRSFIKYMKNGGSFGNASGILVR